MHLPKHLPAAWIDDQGTVLASNAAFDRITRKTKNFYSFLENNAPKPKSDRLAALQGQESLRSVDRTQLVDEEGQHYQVDLERFDDDLLLIRLTESAQLDLQEEHLISSLFKNTQLLIREIDQQGVTTDINAPWKALIGEVPAKNKNTLLSYMPVTDAAKVKRTLEHSLEKQRRFEVSYHLNNVDGESFYITEKANPQYDKAGKFKGYISIAINATAQYRAGEEEQRRKSLTSFNEQLEQELRHSRSPVVTISMDGLIQSANKQFTRLSPFHDESIQGKHINTVLKSTESSDVGELLTHNIMGGTLGSLEPFEFKGQKKNTQAYIRFTSAFLRPDNPVMPSFTLISEDISEKVAASKELEQLNTLMLDFMHNTSDAIQLFNPEGKIVFTNQSWNKTLGYSEYETKHLHLVDIIYPKDQSFFKSKLQSLKKEGKIKNFRIRLQKVNGKIIIANTSISTKNNKLYHAIFQDVTEKVRREEVQKTFYRLMSAGLLARVEKTLLQLTGVELVSLFGEADIFIWEPRKGFRLISSSLGKVNMSQLEGNQELVEVLQQTVNKRQDRIYQLNQQKDQTLLISTAQSHTQTKGALLAYKDQTWVNEDKDYFSYLAAQVLSVLKRKREEDSIAMRTARLNSIFDSTSHMMWSVNIKGELTSQNRAFRNSPLHDYHLSTRGKALPVKNLEDKMQSTYWQKMHQMAFRGSPQQFELKTQSGGEEYWKEIFINPIYKESGDIEEVAGIAHDITQKKQNALGLQENEEKFRNIFESFQDIYFRTDERGTITMISPSVMELCGYRPNQMRFKNINEFFLFSVKRKQALKKLRRKGRIKNFEVPIITADGRVRDFICNIRLRYDLYSDQLLGYEGTARDITELKKATREVEKAKEIAERSLKIKEEFLANMSHEIRTPMNGIIGVIDLIKGTQLNEEQRKYVEIASRSSETLLNILNDILDLAKLEAGKMQLRTSTIETKELGEKVVSLFMQKAMEKSISLDWQVEEDVPEYFQGDETRILQVLTNLTSNAIKFTHEGAVSIRIGRTKENKEDQLLIQVSDTGIGISEESLDKLFESFSQLDIGSTKNYEGTGLGLVISKNLVELMNGEIGVDSQEGRGSTFWFTFEIAPDEGSAAGTDRVLLETELKQIQQAKPTILLVDDNHINREVSKEILYKGCCRVHLAESGMQALERVGKNNYDLIFMDVQMPGVDGVKATQLIKERFQNLPPIIAMTAYSMSDDKMRFTSRGMDGYLPKPIKSEQLLKCVYNYVFHQEIPKKENLGEPIHVSTIDVVDNEVVNKLKNLMEPKDVYQIYDEFLLETSELIALIKQASKNQDLEMVRSPLHTLKGNSGTLGAARLQIFTTELEHKVKTESYFPSEEELEQLASIFHEFKDNILTQLKS